MQLMRIVWIGFTPFQQGNGPIGLTSDIASARYRILVPAAELQKKHHSVSLGSVTQNIVTPELMSHLNTDAVIFSKSFSEINETLAESARGYGAAVIFDICDNHFNHPIIGQHYRNMVRKANVITCNTERMAQVVRQFTDKPCIVIEDTYDGTRQPAKFSPGDTLNLVWFGHPSNLDSLQAVIPLLVKFSKEQQPIFLTIVTKSQGKFNAAAFCAQLETGISHAFSIRFMPWSLRSQQEAIHAADLVIIPSLDNEIKNVKSANRMVEGFLAGRMVVANPIPSYDSYRNWAWIGDDFSAGIGWVLNHKQEIPARIEAAQNYIEQHLSPEIIGRKWENVLSTAITEKPTAQVKSGMRG